MYIYILYFTFNYIIQKTVKYYFFFLFYWLIFMFNEVMFNEVHIIKIYLLLYVDAMLNTNKIKCKHNL